MILILCYTGVRVSELLDLKKQNVNLDEHYFTITKSKTQNFILWLHVLRTLLTRTSLPLAVVFFF